MNNKRTPARQAFRMMTVILALSALPFFVFLLNKKIDERRGIASNGVNTEGLHAEYDLSESTPEEFQRAFKYQMLKNASIETTSVGPAISLGLFLIKDANGQKINVCERYHTIDLIFKAEGVAFSGEIPTLILRGPCIVGSDQLTIESLPLPLKEIVQSSLEKIEFTGEIPGKSETTKIFARNVVEFWPTEWSWAGVMLYSEPQEKPLSINGYEIISVLGKPLILQP